MDIKSFFTKRIHLFIILISSIMMITVVNLPFKAKPFGDITFHEEAKNLALYLKGNIGYDKVMITRAPGPVFFYTPAYLVAPSDATDDQLWLYAVVFTFVIITISLLLIYRVGANLFSKEVGLLAVLLFFVFPIHCYYSLGILAEVPAFFSLTLALYGWTKMMQHVTQKSGWILLVFGLWFLILNRPNSLLILGLGFLILGYSYFKRKDFFYTYGKKLALTFCTVGLLAFGVLQLAKFVTGTKSAQDQTLLFYYVAHEGRFQFRQEPTDFRYWESDTRPDSKDYQNWRKSGHDIEIASINAKRPITDVYREFLINDALEHPFWFTRQFFIKCFYGHLYFINSVKPENFHLGPIHGVIGYWFIILLINAINIIIILGATLFLWKERNKLHYWLFWGIIVALLIFHGLTYMEPRYMFPTRVALYLMSAAGLYQLPWIQRKVNYISKFIFTNTKQIS